MRMRGELHSRAVACRYGMSIKRKGMDFAEAKKEKGNGKREKREKRERLGRKHASG